MGYCLNIVKRIKKSNPHFEEEYNLLKKEIEKQAKIINHLNFF